MVQRAEQKIRHLGTHQHRGEARIELRMTLDSRALQRRLIRHKRIKLFAERQIGAQAVMKALEAGRLSRHYKRPDAYVRLGNGGEQNGAAIRDSATIALAKGQMPLVVAAGNEKTDVVILVHANSL